MAGHFSSGAINKETLTYEHPQIACKKNKYKCPSCDNDVIFRKGEIKQPHFSHKKSDNPCKYYDRSNESPEHIEAKMLMKKMLDKKTNFEFVRHCIKCKLNRRIKNNSSSYYCDNTEAILEHQFLYNNKRCKADVALVEPNNNIKCIFEICYKNKTEEDNRPDPWFEIDAESFILLVDSHAKMDIDDGFPNVLQIPCIRKYTCDYCVNKEISIREKERERLQSLALKELTRLQELEIRLHDDANMKNELCRMRNEDQRMIEIQLKLKLKREEERLEEETRLKKIQLESEKERRRYLKKLDEEEKICSMCKINYCKCDSPNFVINKHNVTICATCIKKKCKCVRITNFFRT